MMKSENDIPKFDLADQILAGQRKNASIKRKAPVKNRDILVTQKSDFVTRDSNTSLVPHGSSLEVPSSESRDTRHENNAEQIIAEIVARDIHKFRTDPISRQT
jgi:hypothetical protein